MPDEPDLCIGRTGRIDVVEQFSHEMRPVAGDRQPRIVTEALDVATLVVVGELGEDGPVRRCGKPVRVRKMQDIFQASCPLFRVRFCFFLASFLLLITGPSSSVRAFAGIVQWKHRRIYPSARHRLRHCETARYDAADTARTPSDSGG